MDSTEGIPASPHDQHASEGQAPGPDESTIPEIEFDQDVPPRPEEEIADVLRAKPDVADHSQRPE